MEHLFELRRRGFWIAASITAGSILAYIFQNKILYVLLKPAHGERFIYTSPGGGFDFILQVCLYTGLILSAPVIVYHVLKFIEPLIGKDAQRTIMTGSITAGVLALAGVMFGYFFGLPVALKFLLHQFNISDITALITVSSYLSFVLLYLAGASLVFQVPLWLYIWNRISRIRVRKLMKNQRWVILISFIIAALINPSPRPQDLFLLAMPMILSYEVGVLIVWWNNRSPRPAAVMSMRDQDREQQAAREAKLATLQFLGEPFESLVKPSVEPKLEARAPTIAQKLPVAKPKRQINDLAPRRTGMPPKKVNKTIKVD